MAYKYFKYDIPTLQLQIIIVIISIDIIIININKCYIIVLLLFLKWIIPVKLNKKKNKHLKKEN